MAVLNFINGFSLLEEHSDFFEGKKNIVFDECLCLGKIPFNVFKTDEAIETRIQEIDKSFNISSREQYMRFVRTMREFDFSDVSQIELYFDEDMFCQINMLGLIYYIAMKTREGKIHADVAYHIIDVDSKGSLQERIKESRYLTRQDIDDLSMTFISLINNQDEIYSEEVVQRVIQRIDSFSLLKRAIYNYFYIRTKTFKRIIKRKQNETEYEYVNRMLETHRNLGLGDSYYLAFISNSSVIH